MFFRVSQALTISLFFIVTRAFLLYIMSLRFALYFFSIPSRTYVVNMVVTPATITG